MYPQLRHSSAYSLVVTEVAQFHAVDTGLEPNADMRRLGLHPPAEVVPPVARHEVDNPYHNRIVVKRLQDIKGIALTLALSHDGRGGRAISQGSGYPGVRNRSGGVSLYWV